MGVPYQTCTDVGVPGPEHGRDLQFEIKAWARGIPNHNHGTQTSIRPLCYEHPYRICFHHSDSCSVFILVARVARWSSIIALAKVRFNGYLGRRFRLISVSGTSYRRSRGGEGSTVVSQCMHLSDQQPCSEQVWQAGIAGQDEQTPPPSSGHLTTYEGV